MQFSITALLRRGLCCLLFTAALSSLASTPAEDMADAARNLQATLTTDQQAKANFDFGNEERLNWHFIPRARKGLPLKEMTAVQQRLAHALISSALSQKGYAKAVTIMTLEQVLRELEQGKTGMVRDEELYYISLFGKPGDAKAWGWRLEGHHLALNFTIVNGSTISTSPAFFGTNPAEVLEGPRKGLRVLGAEEDLGRALFRSLNEGQRKTALIATNAPKDIITVADRKVKPLEQAGIAFSDLNKDQKVALRRLVEEYVHRCRAELAATDLAKIEKAGWAKLRFAWAGGTERFQGHYYRVQGPTFLMEYDNVQNNNNHVHSVWRDFESDFGEDLLKRHYEQSHH